MKKTATTSSKEDRCSLEVLFPYFAAERFAKHTTDNRNEVRNIATILSFVIF